MGDKLQPLPGCLSTQIKSISGDMQFGAFIILVAILRRLIRIK